MSVDEFLVVKTDSPQGAEEVLDRAEVHLEEQKNSFEGYGVSQTALLSEAAVETRGSYVLYGIGEVCAAVEKGIFRFDQIVDRSRRRLWAA